jgi:hypothetical protein
MTAAITEEKLLTTLSTLQQQEFKTQLLQMIIFGM